MVENKNECNIIKVELGTLGEYGFEYYNISNMNENDVNTIIKTTIDQVKNKNPVYNADDVFTLLNTHFKRVPIKTLEYNF